MIAKKEKKATDKQEKIRIWVFFTIVWMYLNSVFMCMFHM